MHLTEVGRIGDGEAAEGRMLELILAQLLLCQDGQTRQILEAADVPGLAPTESSRER